MNKLLTAKAEYSKNLMELDAAQKAAANRSFIGNIFNDDVLHAARKINRTIDTIDEEIEKASDNSGTLMGVALGVLAGVVLRHGLGVSGVDADFSAPDLSDSTGFINWQAGRH